MKKIKIKKEEAKNLFKNGWISWDKKNGYTQYFVKRNLNKLDHEPTLYFITFIFTIDPVTWIDLK